MAEKKSTNIIYPEVKLKDVLFAFWRGVKPQKWTMIFTAVAIILANVCSVIAPIFYKQFFDVISSATDKTQTAKLLVQIIIQVAIVNACMWFFYRAGTFLNISFQANTIARLKQQAYDYLMEHSYGFFTNNFTGSLVQRVNRFARAFETLTDQINWTVLPLLTRIIAISIVLSFINKWIVIIILAWTGTFFLFNATFSKWKLKYDIKLAEMDSKTTAYLADTITNQNNVSLFSAFNFESLGYKNVTSNQAKMTKFTWNLDSLIEAGQSFLMFLIEFLIFYFAIKYWESGAITVGVFVMLQVYILVLVDQLWGFTRIIKNFYSAYADSKEMVEIIKFPHEIKDIATAKKLVVNKGEIEFKNLNFNFNQTRQVLKDINLIIKPGEKVAIIGPSGAGKTTFVRLLLRLYEPTDGQILVDNQDICKATQESLRNNISLVPQDPVLFHRTLLENIGYGKRTATRQEIEKVATLAHCDEFIKDLPAGFETYVGERGIKLSGGERQRVAIARAILKNAPILVLDEATSSLDSNSEMLIQDALNVLMQNKTVIVIAHRLSTIQKMDRIIVVDDGQIVEQGNHQELLEKENSLYKKLWTLQAGGFLDDNDKKNEEEIEKEGDDENSDNESAHNIEAKFTSF